MNKVIAKGNLATDPIRRVTSGGTVTASFKLAVNRPPREGRKDKCDFFWVKCFGKQAEAVAANLVKGSEVLVDGMLDAGDNEQPDGTYKSYSEVAARTVEFLRRPNGKPAPGSDETPVEADTAETGDDDIPF